MAEMRTQQKHKYLKSGAVVPSGFRYINMVNESDVKIQICVKHFGNALLVAKAIDAVQINSSTVRFMYM